VELRYEKDLVEKDIFCAAALAAAAFDDSPAYKYMFPGGIEERVDFLEWLFERNFYMLHGYQDDYDGLMRCTYDDEAKELVSFLVLADSSMPRPGLCALLQVGIFAGVFKCGWGGVMQRMVATKDWFDARYKEVIGNTYMLLLERMTVLPSYQGQGVGSRALGKALKDADAAGLPCILSTQLARNVTFYKRAGFHVVDESVAPEELGGYQNWIMKREPTVK